MDDAIAKVAIRDRVLRRVGVIGKLMIGLGDQILFWAECDEREYARECERREMRRVSGKPTPSSTDRPLLRAHWKRMATRGCGICRSVYHCH